MKGLISYRTERSEVYRNRVKRGYIAFAQRIYRLTKKREDILAIKPIVLSFYLHNCVFFCFEFRFLRFLLDCRQPLHHRFLQPLQVEMPKSFG